MFVVLKYIVCLQYETKNDMKKEKKDTVVVVVFIIIALLADNFDKLFY
jgi:hypothetical protein